MTDEPHDGLPDEVSHFSGGLAADDRGYVRFFNGLPMHLFKRQYFVSNHTPKFVRAWHGHQHEAKAVTIISGSALVCAVRVVDWSHPDKQASVHREVLSATNPSVLFIPASHANGFMTLEPGTLVQFLSTASIEESLRDDIRLDARYWDPWGITER